MDALPSSAIAKVLISLDDKLLRRVDCAARARGLSRSGYLAHLGSEDLARTRGPGTEPAARRALARLDELVASSPSGDSTAGVRAQRDAR